MLVSGEPGRAGAGRSRQTRAAPSASTTLLSVVVVVVLFEVRAAGRTSKSLNVYPIRMRAYSSTTSKARGLVSVGVCSRQEDVV